MIPSEEEKVECCNNGCTDQAVTTWSSNVDPEDKQDLCKKCQLEELGGLPDGVDPIKHSTTSNSNGRVNNNNDSNSDRIEDRKEDVEQEEMKQRVNWTVEREEIREELAELAKERKRKRKRE